jgi:hypothetical protein
LLTGWQGNSQRGGTILDSLDPTVCFGESVSPLEIPFKPAHLPGRNLLPALRLSKPSGQNYSRHDAWQWFVSSAMADLLGSDFSLAESHKLYRGTNCCCPQRGAFQPSATTLITPKGLFSN